MPRYFASEKERIWHEEQEGSWRFAQRSKETEETEIEVAGE
jgi:hypothetical protein